MLREYVHMDRRDVEIEQQLKPAIIELIPAGNEKFIKKTKIEFYLN